MRETEYEAMFLLDNNQALEDFEGASGVVDQLLEKHGATIVQREKWDERKLAYEIKGHRRATYYLVYFEGPTSSMSDIEEDLGLNEVVLRHMFIRLEEPIAEYIEKRATEREALAEDSRRNSLSGWGGGRDRDRDRKRRDDKPRGDRADKPADAKPDASAEAPKKEEAASS